MTGVSEVAGQVVAAAAVLGRPFDPDLIRAVSGRSDEETVTALEELTRRGLLAESDARRARVPARAGATRRVRADERGPAAAPARPRRRRARPAQRRRDRPAPPARRPRRRSGRRLPARRRARARPLRERRGARGVPRGARARATTIRPRSTRRSGISRRSPASTAARSTATRPPPRSPAPERLGAVEHRIGLLHERRGEWELAEHSFEDALRTDPPPALAARIVADRSLNAHRRRRDDEAESLAQDALALAEQAADSRALAQAHNILGVLASGRGDHAEARAQLEQSLALATADDDPVARAAALNNLALALRAEGELDRALELTEEALALCVAVGDRHREAALENNAADLLQALGRTDEAMERLKSAVATFAEIGEDAAAEPEIWKLVEW